MSGRDFDKDNIVEKMMALREKRDLEFLNKDLNNINVDSDYQKHISKSKVLNVKYLGKLGVENENKELEEKEIYLLEVQIEESDGRIRLSDEYRTEDGELIAGDNKEDQYEDIIRTEKFKDQEELLEKLKEIDKDGELDLNKIENEKLEEIAKALGIKKEDLDKISEMELEELNKSKEKRNEIDKKEIEKISTKTEIDASERVTDSKTIEEMLEVEDKGYTKIAVVYSDKLQDDPNSSTFSFVGIRPDGSAEKIDSLIQKDGKNPNREINALNEDGSKVEKRIPKSMYQIGNDELGRDVDKLAISYGDFGEIKVDYARTAAEDNNESISIPVETERIKPTTREVQEFANQKRNVSIKEETERAKEQGKMGNDTPNVRQIDDDKTNNGDTSFEYNKSESFEINPDYARKVMQASEKIENAYNEDDVKYILKDMKEKGESLDDFEQVVKKVEERAEEQILPGQPRR